MQEKLVKSVPIARKATLETRGHRSSEVLAEFDSNEVVFAVVGHVGSGTSEIAEALKAILETQGYDAELLKARAEIAEWASSSGMDIPAGGDPDMAKAKRLQDLGDEMRATTHDNSAIARALVKRIRSTRAKKLGVTPEVDEPVPPDGSKRAYILDSLRHPAEVALLRSVYQDAFALIGVVCDETERETRISEKFRDAGHIAAKEFMERDARAPEPHGQRVADTFHLADFFVDNSVSRSLPGTGQRPNPEWDVKSLSVKFLLLIRSLPACA